MREAVARMDKVWSLLAALGLLLSVGALYALFTTPQPDIAAAQARHLEAEAELRNRIVEVQTKNAELSARLDELTWRLSADEVAAHAMDQVNRQARERGLKVVAFRPQRILSAEGINQQPFVVALEGSYTSVLGFARDLETLHARLAVTTVQVSSADAASDMVSATVGIAAFHGIASTETRQADQVATAGEGEAKG